MIRANGLKKIYRRGTEDVSAVDGVSLEIKDGEMIAITGPSGSGKSTLLHILGCLDNPTEGSLEIDGNRIFGGAKAMGESQLTRIRRELYGYVFQKFYLVPTLTVLENVALPRIFFKNSGSRKRPQDLLKQLGLEHRMNHLPYELSGGEMQRAAIARALINDPKILLADEPTGNLDSRRADEIRDILRALSGEGITVVLVTHNPEMAQAAHRVIELRDGKIH